MATYKIVELKTGIVTWTDDGETADFVEDQTENGEPLYEVELYCTHLDDRQCQGMGH